ncbi:hypothetical protein B0H14DRAFT_2580345 [Mycena olivaceomarginata]|nr:hypothetical protein B0H14DRAFT_2580345 [Mycena olivaceomarginata]
MIDKARNTVASHKLKVKHDEKQFASWSSQQKWDYQTIIANIQSAVFALQWYMAEGKFPLDDPNVVFEFFERSGLEQEIKDNKAALKTRYTKTSLQGSIEAILLLTPLTVFSTVSLGRIKFNRLGLIQLHHHFGNVKPPGLVLMEESIKKELCPLDTVNSVHTCPPTLTGQSLSSSPTASMGPTVHVQDEAIMDADHLSADSADPLVQLPWVPNPSEGGTMLQAEINFCLEDLDSASPLSPLSYSWNGSPDFGVIALPQYQKKGSPSESADPVLPVESSQICEGAPLASPLPESADPGPPGEPSSQARQSTPLHSEEAFGIRAMSIETILLGQQVLKVVEKNAKEITDTMKSSERSFKDLNAHEPSQITLRDSLGKLIWMIGADRNLGSMKLRSFQLLIKGLAITQNLLKCDLESFEELGIAPDSILKTKIFIDLSIFCAAKPKSCMRSTNATDLLAELGNPAGKVLVANLGSLDETGHIDPKGLENLDTGGKARIAYQRSKWVSTCKLQSRTAASQMYFVGANSSMDDISGLTSWHPFVLQPGTFKFEGILMEPGDVLITPPNRMIYSITVNIQSPAVLTFMLFPPFQTVVPAYLHMAIFGSTFVQDIDLDEGHSMKFQEFCNTSQHDACIAFIQIFTFWVKYLTTDVKATSTVAVHLPNVETAAGLLPNTGGGNTYPSHGASTGPGKSWRRSLASNLTVHAQICQGKLLYLSWMVFNQI